MDIDLIINEVFQDNEAVYVEYGGGPMSYSAR